MPKSRITLTATSCPDIALVPGKQISSDTDRKFGTCLFKKRDRVLGLLLRRMHEAPAHTNGLTEQIRVVQVQASSVGFRLLLVLDQRVAL
jgi:hypothetical protein